MPEKATVEAAKQDMREGKSASTAAGEFVKQEMDHIREGKHGARNIKQAIAIGLSEARRAGIPVGARAKGTTSEATRRKAEHDLERGQSHPVTSEPASNKWGRARLEALKKEPHRAASHDALSRHAKATAHHHGHRRAA